MRRVLFFASLGLLLSTSLLAQDWTRFRGPDGAGITNSSSLPTTWSPNTNMGWKAELPGPGASSPIIVNGKVFVTCYTGYGMDRDNPGNMEDLMRHLLCFDLNSGEKLWQKDIKPVLPEDEFSGAGVPQHGYASHTPVSDGENVYVYLGKTGALAFDMDGNQLWQTSLGKESDPYKWGSSSSPIVFEDTLIVTASAESQSVVGLNKKTGEEIWRQEASLLDGMWGTPSLISVEDNRVDLVVCVAKEMWGMNPTSGELRWMANTTDAQHAYTSLINEGNRVFVFAGRGGGSLALDAGGSGDVTESQTVWKGRDTASFASPVLHNGKIYVISRGFITVVNAADGKRVDRLRLKGAQQTGGRFGSLDYASPIIVGDQMMYLNGSGQMFVFDLAGDELKQLAVNQVTADKEIFWGSPAVSNNRLVMRSDKHLYCVTDKGEKVDQSQEELAQSQPESVPEEAEGQNNRRGGGGRSFDPMAMFDRMDADKDGSLSEKELEGNQMAETVMNMDSDGDKAVTKDEFRAGLAKMQQRGGGGSRGGGGRSGYGSEEQKRPERPERPKGSWNK